MNAKEEKKSIGEDSLKLPSFIENEEENFTSHMGNTTC